MMRRGKEANMTSAAVALSGSSPQALEKREAAADEHIVAATIDPTAPPLLDLSVRDQEVIFSAVLNPPSPNEHLRAAAKKYFRRNRP